MELFPSPRAGWFLLWEEPRCLPGETQKTMAQSPTDLCMCFLPRGKKNYRQTKSQEKIIWLRWPLWLRNIFKHDTSKKSVYDLQVDTSLAEKTDVQDES